MRSQMAGKILVLGMSALLAACVGGPEGRLAYEPAPNDGNVAVSAVGTPVLVALKIPLCAATLAIAAPASAIAGLSPTIDGREAQLALGDGVEHNCGPPW